MSKTVSSRLPDDLHREFISAVESLYQRPGDVLHRLVCIFVDVNARLQPSVDNSLERRYIVVREEIDRFLAGLNDSGGF